VTRSMPFVSIILPTYNRAELLPRSVGSVLSQSFADWELIIWDDGSTDNTPEVVQSFADGRVTYLRDVNHGVAFARNRVIAASRGEYVAFLDSDDEWKADKLTVQVDALQDHPEIDILFTDFLNLNESRNEEHRAFEQNSQAMSLLGAEQIDDGLVVIRSGLLESLAVDNYIATDSVIMRRALLGRTGGFNEALRNSEDFELWWRMGLAGVLFAYVNRVLLTRHKPPASLSSSSIPALENGIKALDFCAEAARVRGREDLVPHLRHQYANAWQNMTALHGSAGDGKAMTRAFLQSMRYGLSLGSLRLLLEALQHRGTHGESGGQVVEESARRGGR
jgi:glycosyltransferase involved in cell wall biosynthesis